MKDRVIIALDFSTKEQAFAFLDLFGNERPFVKIGMELYYAEGPSIVRELKARGHKVFLDLKIHDIPNTARQAMKVVSGLGADILNVHAAGTVKMMEAAREGAGEAMLIAVTQLTSTSQEQMNEDLLIDDELENCVLHYAQNAKKAGLNGVVCSPWESQKIHEVCGDDFVTVTPGIRFADSDKGDQTRIATPAKARELKCNYIVVGRPITKSEDPVSAYYRCIEEFGGNE